MSPAAVSDDLSGQTAPTPSRVDRKVGPRRHSKVTVDDITSNKTFQGFDEATHEYKGESQRGIDVYFPDESGSYSKIISLTQSRYTAGQTFDFLFHLVNCRLYHGQLQQRTKTQKSGTLLQEGPERKQRNESIKNQSINQSVWMNEWMNEAMNGEGSNFDSYLYEWIIFYEKHRQWVDILFWNSGIRVNIRHKFHSKKNHDGLIQQEEKLA